MYGVILCGGSGTRLWPLSRKNFPKQFLKLVSDRSLLQETFLRLKKIMPAENIIFVTNKQNFFNVVNQIKEIENNYNENQIITEPASLNTLPAITYAVKYLIEKKRADLNSPVLITPSDHHIKNEDDYAALIKNALADIGDHIGTVGITPAKPETGYGYIKKGLKKGGFFQVEKFVEKPDKKTAEQYIKSGDYVWNSGMYLFKIKTFLSELKKHSPETFSVLAKPAKEFIAGFGDMPKISIDFGISEKSDKIAVFEGDFGWSDIGSFDSLSEITGQEKNKKHVSINSKNIFIHSASNRLIATSGVEDLIIIENRDSILVQKKGESENIKQVVEHLNEKNYREAEHNMKVHRPWGKYEVLIEEAGVKAKKITVYPGAKLSLQSHYHRAEHWVVVKGTAKIVNGDKELFLRENESTFIPAMNKHRLENPGKTNLEIIEVQTGNYTEEDDIIRYEDVYNR